ncbi:MAG TPA: hypothetical protein VJQ56_06870 [Blastocatellia bacterium]|nr:hypothetical protein [Blastocatellia bacterium]
MIDVNRLKEEIALLEDSIEMKVKTVSDKLAVTHVISDLEQDAAELTELLQTRKDKYQLLAQLAHPPSYPSYSGRPSKLI